MHQNDTTRQKGDTLEDRFNRIIAKLDNISEQDVTVEYIRQQREKIIYPTTRFDSGSEYGGYDGKGLKFLTRNEFDELERKVNIRQKSIFKELSK